MNARELMHALERPHGRILFLDLNEPFSDKEFPRVLQSMRTSRNLRITHVSLVERASIPSDQLSAVVRALASNTHPGNSIAALQFGATQDTRTMVNDDVARAVASALSAPIFQSIRLLGLGSANLSLEGLRVVLRAVAESQLHDVQLDNIHALGDAAVPELVRVIRSDHSLKYLTLSQTRLTETGQNDVLDAAEFSPSLGFVYMTCTSRRVENRLHVLHSNLPERKRLAEESRERAGILLQPAVPGTPMERFQNRDGDSAVRMLVSALMGVRRF
jgi:hypothetical protein